MKTPLAVSITIAAVLCGFANRSHAQWYQFPDLRYTNIWGVLAAHDSTIFLCGDNMTLLRTTDNGTTWTSVFGNGINADTVLSLAEAGGYIFAGTNGVESVYRSSDDGNTWTAANSGLPGSARINGFTSKGNTIYAATDGGVYRSANSGMTWQADTAGLALNQSYPGDGGGTVGIATGGSMLYTIKLQYGSVYATPSDSIPWTQVLPDTFSTGYAIAALDSNVFIATLRGIYFHGGIGSGWVARNNGLPVSDTMWLTSCLLMARDSVLVAYVSSTSNTTYSRGLYFTSDLGQTWKPVDDSALGGAGVNSVAANAKYLFAGTQTGAWRVPISDVITSVNLNGPRMPSAYSLEQNYPNPFNPTTEIGYQLSVVGRVTLKVYDVLGREVATLVDGVERPGSYTVNFDGSRLSSGVYFYSLQADGFRRTMKMMLLK